ncbi:MAG: P-II family nitrogen regulator [Deltaproteobacteria bacterium]|nr:P-II family nitrogen regulator [Deltaproteobacteria bacterium]
MKRTEATMRLFKVGEVKAALMKEGIQGMTFSEVRDFSQHKGRREHPEERVTSRVAAGAASSQSVVLILVEHGREKSHS